MKENAIEVIKHRMIFKDTLLCCGLDPDLSKIPIEPAFNKLSKEERIKTFFAKVIDITANHVCAYKLQKAFFDRLSLGHDTLKEVISYIHKNHVGIPAIIDCKMGDIENTKQAYLSNILGELEADGVVVNPYMGDDVMKPLAKYPDKAIIVLAKTSNPGGGIVQDINLESGIPLWQYILKLTIERWNSSQNMIPVISSTVGLDMTRVRKLIPDEMLILLAGIGTQGGSYSDLSKLLNSKRSGVFVNSSRGILYPQLIPDQMWQSAVELEAIRLKTELNKERKLGNE